jgi:ABC-type amino acid transport substrate-binding protein
MQWVGPIQSHKSYFYEAADHPSNITSLAEAAEVKNVCVLSGNVHQTMLSKMDFDNLVLAATYRQCVELLLRGRVALMPAGEHPVFMNDPEIKGKIIRTQVLMNQSDGYMGLSLNVDKALVDKLQASLEKLKQTDDYKQIIMKYSEEHMDVHQADLDTRP